MKTKSVKKQKGTYVPINNNHFSISKSVIAAAILSSAITLFALLPTLIKYNGSLFLFGDYMSQIIPFIKESRRLLLAGNPTWSMNSFLGSDFIGTYSYYTLGDPFFYPLLLLPERYIPQGLTIVFILKHALATVFAFLYLRTYLKKQHYALAGALIYTFSSFTFDSTYYYIFLNTIFLFPLVLYFCDRCLVKKKRAMFVFVVALHAIMNYYLFVSTSVFFLIYLFFKMRYGRVRSVKDAAACVLLYAFGAFCAAGILLPSALTLLDTGRAVDSFSSFFIKGLTCVPQTIKIIKAIFLPSEGILGSANGFSYSTFCSNAAFLPLFGAFYTVTALYIKENKWYFKLIKLLFWLSIIPFGNSVFSLFSNPNYTRWWYAFVLMSVLCSIIILESAEQDPTIYQTQMKKSVRAIVIGSTVCMVLPLIAKLLFSGSRIIDRLKAKLPENAVTALKNSGFTKKIDADDVRYIVAFLLLCFLSYFVLFLLIKKRFIYEPHKLICAILAVCAMSYCVYLSNEGNILAKEPEKDVEWVSQTASNEQIDYSCRIDYQNKFHNMGMIVNQPTINTFSSFKSKATCRFCDLIGIKIDSFAKKRFDTPAIQAVLSVGKTVDADGKVMDCEYYVPFGYVYDYYIEADPDEIKATTDKKENNKRIQNMCSACYLDRETAQILSPLLEPYKNVPNDNWKAAIKQAKKTACGNIHIDQNSVTAITTGEKTRLLYFSIPHNRGWEAYVNDEPADIYTVNGGMMGIVAGPGESSIRFVYHTPGLKMGMMISLVSLVCLIGFALAEKRSKIYHDEGR